MAWGVDSGRFDIAFGTHSHLQVWENGGLYDITPTLAKAASILSNPLTTLISDTKITVAHPAHGFETGDMVEIVASAAVGGVTPNGTYAVSVVDEGSYYFINDIAASSSASNGGGIVTISPQAAFEVGNINGAGQAGYGTGAYGEGPYASPSSATFFPRTWSGGAYGEDLVASPRGGTIYRWDSTDTAEVAVPVAGAPNNVTYCLVSAQNFIFALGCNEETSGEFNPLCVRHHSVNDSTDWATGTTDTAREYVLPGGGRIVAGRVIGDAILVWTTSGLFLFRYIGQLTAVYRFDQVGAGCGLIAPGAAVVINQTAFWISPDRQFWSYSLGGEPQPMACPIREDFADNLAAAQADKIVAATVAEFNEVWWHYPDARDGSDNSRYIAVPFAGPDAGAWFRGQMARTARMDAGPATFALAVESTIDGEDATGMAYWHERGASADGGVLSWFIESADQFMSDDRGLLWRSYWPDAEYQTGPVSLTLTTRDRPRGAERSISYTYSPEDEKVDIRASGRLAKYRFSGSSSPAAYRQGRPIFDLVPTGMR